MIVSERIKYSILLSGISTALLFGVTTIKSHALMPAHPVEMRNYLTYQSSMVDDVYIMSLYKENSDDSSDKENDEDSSKTLEHKDESKDARESKKEESKKEDKKEEPKEDKAKSQSENKEEPKFESPEPVGTLRLANHNHDKQTMIDHINRFYAGTPMAGTGESAVDAGIKYNVDPYAVAAISRTESGRGAHCANTNNPFGRKAIGGGYMSWGSFSEALYDEASYLARVYLNRGLTNWDSIGHVYCETGGWASTNRSYQAQIRDN